MLFLFREQLRVLELRMNNPAGHPATGFVQVFAQVIAHAFVSKFVDEKVRPVF